MTKTSAVTAATLAVLAFSACPPATPPAKDKGAAKAAKRVIGAEGGTLASADGALEVEVPEGALADDVTLTVEASEEVDGAIGTVWDIGPSGTTFAVPIRLTFHYADADLGAVPATSLRAANYADDTWVVLGDPVLDTDAHTVSGVTTHLSLYGNVTADAARVCGPITGGCAAPVGGGSCTPDVTCSAGDACAAQYVGATLSSCVQEGTFFTGTCCFEPDEPVCVSVSNAGACPVGTECPPPPTCEGSQPCGGLEGSSVSACTNEEHGTAATCCWPAGTPLPVPDPAPPVGPPSGGGSSPPP